jgi:hypothetical protein
MHQQYCMCFLQSTGYPWRTEFDPSDVARVRFEDNVRPANIHFFFRGIDHYSYGVRVVPLGAGMRHRRFLL